MPPLSAKYKYAVAIDLAKHHHVATIFDFKNMSQCESIKVPVTLKGLAKLAGCLQKYSDRPNDFIVGCEATGHLGETMLKRLQIQGYSVIRLNPTQVVQFRRGLGVRAKTDGLDANAMARQLAVIDAVPDLELDETAERLRRLTRLRLDFVEEQTSWVNRARALLNQLGPEIEVFFKDFTAFSTLEILIRFPSRKAIAEASVDELGEVARRSSHGIRGRDFAARLQDVAKHSIGLDDEWLIEEFRIVLRHLRGVVQTVSELENQINACTNAYLEKHSRTQGFETSLTPADFPIQATLTLGTLLGEMGRADRFETLPHLLSFFGWCPQTYESGMTSKPHPAMSRKGNRFARRVIFLQAIVAIRQVPE
jgi:transposase